MHWTEAYSLLKLTEQLCFCKQHLSVSSLSADRHHSNALSHKSLFFRLVYHSRSAVRSPNIRRTGRIAPVRSAAIHDNDDDRQGDPGHLVQGRQQQANLLVSINRRHQHHHLLQTNTKHMDATFSFPPSGRVTHGNTVCSWLLACLFSLLTFSDRQNDGSRATYLPFFILLSSSPIRHIQTQTNRYRCQSENGHS